MRMEILLARQVKSNVVMAMGKLFLMINLLNLRIQLIRIIIIFTMEIYLEDKTQEVAREL